MSSQEMNVLKFDSNSHIQPQTATPCWHSYLALSYTLWFYHSGPNTCAVANYNALPPCYYKYT